MRDTNSCMAKFKPALLMMLCFTQIIAPVFAIELSAIKEDHQLLVKITDIHYPHELLTTEVNSGLQSRFYSIINFEKDDEVFTPCSYSLNVTYDLWDEHYHIIVINNNKLTSTFNLTDVHKVYRKLKNLEIRCPLNTIQSKGNIRIKGQVFVNPVEHKRIEKIKSWINSSKGHKNDRELGMEHNNIITVNGQGIKSIMKNNTATARPRFEKLFDKILTQYAGTSDVISLWKSTVAIKKINLQQEKDEK